MIVRDIYDFINSIAPFSTSQEWDNGGLLLGSHSAECKRIMLALDITNEVAKQAIEQRVDLIITHHPAIFSPLKKIDFSSPVAKLIMAQISVISAHTCFDIAQGGMNDILCEKLNLKDVRTVTDDDGFSFRIGKVEQPVSAKEFAEHTARALNSNCVCSSLGEKTIKTVAVCSGAGGCVVPVLKVLGVDALVTGELKYNNVIELYECGIAAIVAGHFETECIFKDVLKNMLFEKFDGVEVFIADEKPYLMGV